MADKRPLCKLCRQNHWLREPHVFTDETKPPCPNCGLLEAEVAMLKRRLAARVTETVTVKPETVTVKPRGRPISGNALTSAQKQRAYRERHDH